MSAERETKPVICAEGADMTFDLYDYRGTPVAIGDIIKVFHFIGARNKKHYMYKQIIAAPLTGTDNPVQYLKLSHLDLRDGFFLVRADGRVMKEWEIVQSANCDRPKTSITFYWKGAPYASRTWWNVPRVGDEVMLQVKGKKKAFRVLRVVRGVESDTQDMIGWQAVNIEIDLANQEEPT